MRISQYYQFPAPANLPFVDVNVLQDNRLFLDPRAIRLDTGHAPHVDQAKRAMTTFIDEVRSCVLSPDPFTQARGLKLLQDFSEPWQTRLGLAANGFRGHGGAENVGRWIWDALNTNAGAFRRVALLAQLEDIPLFVEGIANDITSDLTTRIVFQALVDFTAQMLNTYPEFSTGKHTLKTGPACVWDSHNRTWRDTPAHMPVANGKELLLVPRTWVTRSLLIHPRRYYEVSVLDYIQDLETVYLKDGEPFTPRKEDLKARPDLPRTRDFLLNTTLKAADDGVNLLRRFKTFVDERHAPLTDEQIYRRTAA